jgi:two-component system nitrogen regulation sensor histidine kinase NtrY
MTSVASADQNLPAEISAAPTSGRAIRTLGPVAAGLALLSAFVTFVVLADLTPISPSHSVVVTCP